MTAGERTPGISSAPAALYRTSPSGPLSPRSARGNPQVSARFRERGQEHLAWACCSREDGATDTKRAAHKGTVKASVAEPSPTPRA